MDSIHATYKNNIQPVPSEEFWDTTNYIKTEPPIIKRPIRRPKVHNRKRDPIEALMDGDKLKKTFRVTCSKCGEKGHNFKTCKGAPSNTNGSQRGKRLKELQIQTLHRLRCLCLNPHLKLNKRPPVQTKPKPATRKSFRARQPVRKAAIRKSPPPTNLEVPSHPLLPSSLPHETDTAAGSTKETMIAASAGTQRLFKFMATPGLNK
ncbi:hypothetical protein PIB30_042105 [Stylosanthes scabra]|uniref:CCHC-type domain-containing protein n=1 Tax=Stylosanthes scabra TaxID=79078 RepID=A0ABU6UEC6_9FABA|nr:hypothetical protein [Stylosanthes scabra]